MRILSCSFLLLTLVLTLFTTLSSALFFPLIKALKAHTSSGGFGGNYYAANYGYGRAYGSPHGSAYGSPYNSGYGSPYNSGYGSPQRYGYGAHYNGAYRGGGGGSKRRGRTYTDIARVINPDVYVGGGRFSPRQPFYNLG